MEKGEKNLVEAEDNMRAARKVIYLYYFLYFLKNFNHRKNVVF